MPISDEKSSTTSMSFGEFRGRWLDQIFDDAKLTPSDQCVMYALTRFLNRKAKERRAIASNQTLADSSHRDLSSVKRAIAKSVQLGHVEILTKGRTRILVLKLKVIEARNETSDEAHGEPVEAHGEPVEAHGEPLEAQRDSTSPITTEESKPDSRFNTLNYDSHSDIHLAPAAPYTDIRHELWEEGPLILAQLGIGEKRADKMIGKWLKDVKDDCARVYEAIKSARVQRTRDPISWITGCLKVSATPSRRPSSDDAVVGAIGRAIERSRARRRADNSNVIDADFAVAGGAR